MLDYYDPEQREAYGWESFNDYHDDFNGATLDRLNNTVLTRWEGNAQATWHLDAVYLIDSVILRTRGQAREVLFDIEVLNSETSSATACTYISKSEEHRRLNFYCL